jgi:hypothetical protein
MEQRAVRGMSSRSELQARRDTCAQSLNVATTACAGGFTDKYLQQAGRRFPLCRRKGLYMARDEYLESREASVECG